MMISKIKFNQLKIDGIRRKCDPAGNLDLGEKKQLMWVENYDFGKKGSKKLIDCGISVVYLFRIIFMKYIEATLNF